MLVAKFNEIQMKGKHEEIITDFYMSNFNNEHPEEFVSKVSGYCLVYAPYYICFLESADTEYLDSVLRGVQEEVGQRIHEQVWCIFSTEEVPERAFDDFNIRSFNGAQSQCEIKGLPMFERVQKIYTAMIALGIEVRRVLHDPSKNKAHLDSVFSTQSHQNLPAQEDLQSVLGPEMMSLREHLELYSPCDILLEDELCWPVKPDLDY